MNHRKSVEITIIGDIKTRLALCAWDKKREYLLIASLVSGIEVT